MQPLWDFLAIAEAPAPADVIFVFGSQDFAVPARAAELYRDGHAPWILVTGSFGRMMRQVFAKPEALVFKDRIQAAGVPEAVIVAETEATNTLENTRLGMAALGRQGVRPRSALLVAKGFVMRRAVATFTRQCPDLQVRPCPPAGGLREARDRGRSAFAERLVAELDRLEQYAARGDISPEPIPPTVRAAARRIAAMRP